MMARTTNVAITTTTLNSPIQQRELIIEKIRETLGGEDTTQGEDQ